MKESFKKYEPVDLGACYAPSFELPTNLIEKWRNLWQEKYGVEQKSLRQKTKSSMT